jgi:hypothetical protein
VTPDERCPLCHVPYEDDPTDPARYVDVCAPCDRAEKAFAKRFGTVGDADFIYHELAHFVLRYGKVPCYRRDWRAMDRELDRQTVGRAQIHEMRVLALQGCAYLQLGWKLSWKRLVRLSWGGLDEAAAGNGPESYLRGLPVVTTESAARREVLRYSANTRQKKVDLLARTIMAFRSPKKDQAYD